jgi:hypothetical protein
MVVGFSAAASDKPRFIRTKKGLRSVIFCISPHRSGQDYFAR